MPSFAQWGPPGSRLPLTPPEYQQTWRTSAHMAPGLTYYSSQSDYPGRGQSGREFIDRYTHSSTNMATKQEMNPRGQQPQMFGQFDYGSGYPQATDTTMHYHYGHKTTAPTMLPPFSGQGFAMRGHPRASDRQAEDKRNAKDHVPSGGVAARLDYDLETMAKFVTEMTQNIVIPTAQYTDHFHRYVLSILTSTRLPSSTIILGLFYLASRMKVAARDDPDHASESVVPSFIYKALTMGLLLGSKYLDDNTFQNRSWADVSSIPVVELNRMELEWLKGFGWCLHGSMFQDEEGFFTWRAHWEAFESNASVARTSNAQQKLAPIDTTTARLHALSHHQPRPLNMSPEGPIPLQYQRPSQYDTQWACSMIADYSPPSAQESSGPVTPEYYSNANWPQAPPPYSRQSYSTNVAPMYQTYRSQPPSYPHTPSHLQAPPHSVWKSHGQQCGCSMCLKHNEVFYHPQSGYGVQTSA